MNGPLVVGSSYETVGGVIVLVLGCGKSVDKYRSWRVLTLHVGDNEWRPRPGEVWDLNELSGYHQGARQL